jgi:hypothetical protein
MIAIHDQPQLLGIEAMSNLSRAHDVAEQNAHLTALSLGTLWARDGEWFGANWKSVGARLSEGCNRV